MDPYKNLVIQIIKGKRSFVKYVVSQSGRIEIIFCSCFCNDLQVLYGAEDKMKFYPIATKV